MDMALKACVRKAGAYFLVSMELGQSHFLLFLACGI